MAVSVMDPILQEQKYGFSYPPLPPEGLDPAIDAALKMVANGTEPALIRELDAWTGKTHFEYSLPGGPSGNVNIWEIVDGKPMWRDASGNLTATAPSWAPAPPTTPEYTEIIQRPVTVMYPGGSQPVTLQNPQYAPRGYDTTVGARFDPNTGRYLSNAVPQTDQRPGVTNTTVPAGSQTQARTRGNQTSTNTMDEQVQAAAIAATGRTELSWDEWGFYYAQIYGENAPAPEDAGYTRAADGTVLIGGQPRYPYATWKAAAFGHAVSAPETPAEPREPGAPQTSMNYPLAFVAAIVAGYSGWHKFA